MHFNTFIALLFQVPLRLDLHLWDLSLALSIPSRKEKGTAEEFYDLRVLLELYFRDVSSSCTAYFFKVVAVSPGRRKLIQSGRPGASHYFQLHELQAGRDAPL
ncbi:hypothetical protein BDZ97DRAFT_1849343, partial [Flammula alnicola]